MVISQYNFVGYDHPLLTLILIGIFALASIVVWVWNQKPPLSLILGLAALGGAWYAGPPDFVINVGVLVVMAIGAWLERTFLRTTRGLYWVLTFAVWTVGNVIYDFKTPHWVSLNQDKLIDEKGDLRTLMKRPAVKVVHATRKVQDIEIKMEFWSVQNNDQALQLYGDELYTDTHGHLLTGRGVANAIGEWSHRAIIEKALPPQSIDLKPWEKH